MIMKKLVSMTMAMAMMAALFVACGDDGTDDETPPPAVPTIALDGGDIDQPQEITNPMSVKIGVTAPGAIAGFTVTIDSPALNGRFGYRAEPRESRQHGRGARCARVPFGGGGFGQNGPDVRYFEACSDDRADLQ